MSNSYVNSHENWSSERVKDLTMSRISPKHSAYTKSSRPLLAIVACFVLLLTISIPVYATDAFGIRSFFERYWIVNEDSETIELNVYDITFSSGNSSGETEFQSISLSPTKLSLSYVYTSNTFETIKPWAVFLLMNDRTFIYIDITDYSIEGNLFTGTGDIYPAVNLDEVSEVSFWWCYGESGYGSSGISVHSGDINHYEWFALHLEMLEFLDNLER
jgi:hypothetical protein